MNSVYERALVQAKRLIDDQELSISETLEKLPKIFLEISGQKLTFEELDRIRKELEKKQDQALIIEGKDGFKPWIGAVDTDHYYSKLYKEYLLSQQKFPPSVVKTIGLDTEYILDRMGNPHEEVKFKRKGLVVGHVQSGKTANYISLINYAADYGYKLIILIAGVHNNLRSQTQVRLNEGFIGYDNLKQEKVGVGCLPNGYQDSRRPFSGTNTENDFSAKAAGIIPPNLESHNTPVVLVIKKNGATLRNLLKWLSQHIDQEKRTLLNFPTLIIDDEADNASINTKKSKDDSPTAINGLIRDVVNQFNKVSYIGFTATPFANIFINPEVDHEEFDKDLFPDDFIVSLNAPSNYCGPDQFFGLDSNDAAGSGKCEVIDDYDQIIPVPIPAEFVIESIPLSLKRAIRHFLLGTAIKELRGLGKHSSMLVNISHKTVYQGQINDLIKTELEKIQRAVRFEGSKPLDSALQNSIISSLQETYDQYFSDTEFVFEDVFKELDRFIDQVCVREINKDSSEKLDYENYTEDGLKVIAVGGYSLSRGFTLIHLITSYLLRNTVMSDTLLQMGRWFGYRDDYFDLCKVFLPGRTYDWYRYISSAMDELRAEFSSMREMNLTPRLFGLKVRSSPVGLMITAKNKMYSANKIKTLISYSGKSYSLPQLSLVDDDIVANRSLVAASVNGWSDNQDIAIISKENNNLFFYKGVSVEKVFSFLTKFKYVDQGDIAPCLQYITEGIERDLAYWDVAVLPTRNAINKEQSFDFSLLSTSKRTLQSHMFNGSLSVSLQDAGGRIARPWDESYGLTCEQFQKAEREREERGIKQTAAFYRKNRIYPLLIINFMDIYQKNHNEPVKKLIPGFMVSFPYSDISPVNYEVNQIYYKNLFTSFLDENIDESWDDESD